MQIGSNTYSLIGEIMDTTSGKLANIAEIVRKIALVRSMFSESVCHCGKYILWPELSKLRRSLFQYESG